MNREDIRRLVEDAIKRVLQDDELLISLLRQRLTANPCPPVGVDSISAQHTLPSPRGLLLEEDVVALHGQGQSTLQLDETTIITPLAADKARELDVELIRA